MTVKTTTAALALLMALACGPAHADDRSLPSRAASLVGQLIAQQGNAALTQIREELRDDLVRTLRPLLPTPVPATDGASPKDSANATQH